MTIEFGKVYINSRPDKPNERVIVMRKATLFTRKECINREALFEVGILSSNDSSGFKPGEILFMPSWQITQYFKKEEESPEQYVGVRSYHCGKTDFCDTCLKTNCVDHGEFNSINT